jgi:hypothetical protein
MPSTCCLFRYPLHALSARCIVVIVWTCSFHRTRLHGSLSQRLSIQCLIASSNEDHIVYNNPNRHPCLLPSGFGPRLGGKRCSLWRMVMGTINCHRRLLRMPPLPA